MEKEKYREENIEDIYSKQIKDIFDSYVMWGKDVKRRLEGEKKDQREEDKITGENLYKLAINELKLYETEKYKQNSVNKFIEKYRDIFKVKDGYFLSGLLNFTEKQEIPNSKAEILEKTGKEDIIEDFISIPDIEEISALGFLENTFLEIRGRAGMLLGRNSYQSIIEVEEVESLGLDSEQTDYFVHSSDVKPILMGSGRIWYKKDGEWELY